MHKKYDVSSGGACAVALYTATPVQFSDWRHQVIALYADDTNSGLRWVQMADTGDVNICCTRTCMFVLLDQFLIEYPSTVKLLFKTVRT